jgi:hypothetical protein
MMAKNALIVALAGLLVWFGATIVRLENYRYAASLNMCANFKAYELAKRDHCLKTAKTRTSPIYHLLYGLRVL